MAHICFYMNAKCMKDKQHQISYEEVKVPSRKTELPITLPTVQFLPDIAYWPEAAPQLADSRPT